MSTSLSFAQLVRSGISGEYTPRGNIFEADCIVFDAMGIHRTGNDWKPGRLNKLLVEAALNLILPSSLVILAPEEIICVWQFSKLLCSKTIQTGDANQTHRAYQVLSNSLEEMAKQGLLHPILIAHAYLLERAAAIMSQHVEVIVPPGLPTGFDPKNSQFQCRSQLHWTLWNTVLLLEHKLHHRL